MKFFNCFLTLQRNLIVDIKVKSVYGANQQGN